MLIITLLCTIRDLEKIMPNDAEQVVKEVAEGLQTYGFRPLDAAMKKLDGVGKEHEEFKLALQPMKSSL